MESEDKAAITITFGCLGCGFFAFAAIIFTVAAAIKWVMA